MLTLTRREGEFLILYIDGLKPIRIKLSQIKDRHQARISIDAPSEVKIYREEVAGQPSYMEES